ncbi:MAG: hypothetical protein HUJ58_07995 [Erysipelotrichaceae bacterium]|nr:hypothetical protein [Erysipelotrichaceae bacterium]
MKQLKVNLIKGPAECNDPHIPAFSEEYLENISREIGFDVVNCPVEEVAEQGLSVYFVGSGGAEMSFQATYQKLKEPYILIAHQYYNSFAAAMEIMGFLQEHNLRGEIVWGDFKEIAENLKIKMAVAETKKKLSHSRLGCFGAPGGLIASDVDFETFKRKTGCEIVLYPLDELVEECKKGGYPENKWTKQLKERGYVNDRASDAKKLYVGKRFTEEMDKALNIYGALKRLIEKYHLDGVTVRCFDLLGLLHTTGCMALAILNAEGIPAACEGDQKTLVSMYVLATLTGQSSFMVNPSGLDPRNNEIIFSHCTLPMDMPDSYELATHFESGIGIALTSDFKPQEMTIFKTNGDLSKYYAGKAQLVESMHRNDLCRSQMKLRLLEGTDYYLKNPISNHHLIVRGDQTKLIKAFFDSFQ